MTKKWWTYIAGITLIVTMASAQTKEERLADALKKYPEADTNKDGTLTAKEAMAYRAKMRSGKKQPTNELPSPTHADVAYGTHDRNVLDLWLAPSDQPTPLLVNIHGGGMTSGDKSKISRELIETMNAAGISVASINYRFKENGKSRFEGDPPQYPAILHDGARALQFLRHNAATYNLDKTRFAATGGSAGGQMLMWLGFHPDLAQPGHEDPILRESSRLQVLAPRGGQTTVHGPTFLEWFGVESLNLSKKEGTVQSSSEQRQPTEQELALSLDASPITHWTKDDPPIYLYYGGANTPVTEETLWGTWVHHPMLGIKLKEAMYYQGVECYLEYKGAPSITAYESQYDFIIQKLKSLPVGTNQDNPQTDTATWNTTGFKQANTMGGGEATIPETGKFRVFVLMGQSNMQGAGRAHDLKPPYTEKHDRIRIWANGRWETFVPTQRHGPGVSFAHQLADFWPDDTIGIIKVAVGGTGIRGFEKNWSFERANLTFDGKKGSLYMDLMNAVAEAKRISNPEFFGFFWKQGGADGTKKILAEEYYETFKQLVSDLRADLDTPDLPVFVPSLMNDKELLESVQSKMSDDDVLKAKKLASKPPENDEELLKVLLSYLEENGSLESVMGKRPHIANVIMAQNKAGRDILNVTTLFPGELPRIGEGNVHYNSEGYVMLGKITASAVEEFYKAKE
jgi:acetyl esterase